VRLSGQHRRSVAPYSVIIAIFVIIFLDLAILFTDSTLAADLYATRVFSLTYKCDGVDHMVRYRLRDEIAGHPPILAPSVRIVRLWAGHYTEGKQAKNARVVGFRDTVNGVSLHGELLLQMFPGQQQAEWSFAPDWLTLSQQDSITWDVICWGGGLQVTAVWMYYSIPDGRDGP
jgi:hypothetical protein